MLRPLSEAETGPCSRSTQRSELELMAEDEKRLPAPANTVSADRAAKLIERSPGIAASDIAKQLRIRPNYLYRILGDLEKVGRVKEDRRLYCPGS